MFAKRILTACPVNKCNFSRRRELCAKGKFFFYMLNSLLLALPLSSLCLSHSSFSLAHIHAFPFFPVYRRLSSECFLSLINYGKLYTIVRDSLYRKRAPIDSLSLSKSRLLAHRYVKRKFRAMTGTRSALYINTYFDDFQCFCPFSHDS